MQEKPLPAVIHERFLPEERKEHEAQFSDSDTLGLNDHSIQERLIKEILEQNVGSAFTSSKENVMDQIIHDLGISDNTNPHSSQGYPVASDRDHTSIWLNFRRKIKEIIDKGSAKSRFHLINSFIFINDISKLVLRGLGFRV